MSCALLGPLFEATLAGSFFCWGLRLSLLETCGPRVASGSFSPYRTSLQPGSMGAEGEMRITWREVKFADPCRTTICESTSQRCFHQSRTKVWGSKMIRYRRSPVTVNYANSPLNGVLKPSGLLLPPSDSAAPLLTRNPNLRVQGGVRLQERNLKELTE